MDNELSQALDRAAKLRLTDTELCKEAGINYNRLWRVRNGHTVGVTAKMKLLRAIEAALARIEQRGIVL